MAQLKQNNYHKPKNIRGEGTIYYDGSHDLWVGQVPTVYKENGKKAKLTVYGKTPREARDNLEAAKFEKLFLLFYKPDEVTVGQVARHYVDSKFKMNEIEPRTYRRYTDMLKRLESISDTRIIDANAEMLLEFLQTQLDYSQSSICKIKELLYNIFEQAIHMGVIKDNPMKYVKTPKSNKKTKVVRALTIEEQIKLTNVLVEHKPTYWENLFNRLKEQMSSEIRYHEIIEDLVEYRTKLDGTKGLEEKLRDGNIPARMILKALRQKDKYAKKADKFSCYEAAQQIDLQLFSMIKDKFEVFVYPMILKGASVNDIMITIETEIVDKAREILFSEGGNADSLNYTTDTIYGMLYYLTGMCHLNWTDYDNV